MHMLTWLVWCADVIALITALAMLKDTFIDRTAARQVLATLKDAFERLRTTGQRPDMAALQPALRFFKCLYHFLFHSDSPKGKTGGQVLPPVLPFLNIIVPVSAFAVNQALAFGASSGFQKIIVSTAAITNATTKPAITIAQL